ncbi:glycosyltransferase family protein [Rhodococcus globerulus]|uniref:Spore protein YkvP/CgeB glycosyl transferase-like domain-containing protein n=1 Tax=Rhodococcus globerulus TaxID=33008 RepID=A0ABU4BQN8_RHOGO|nr:hypothetical protein [Rhodococcus globerulus]MDV6266542.1 hypothetical protein [Rhodococcus globerulus]
MADERVLGADSSMRADIDSNADVKGGTIFISWVKYHGRSEAIADAVGAKAVFIVDERENISVIRRYFRQSVATYGLIRKTQPRVVIAMLPPAPLILVLLLAGVRRAQIVADLHTGFFTDPKWKWACNSTLRILRRSMVIVTNSDLKKYCDVQGNSTLVMHDLLESPDDAVERTFEEFQEPTVLCPLSYANDEPLAEILEAAANLTSVKFIFTGNAPEWVRVTAPSNIEFAGYLSNEKYWETLNKSWCVLALTTRDSTMQRAGYEALISGKPLLTSDHSVLRDYFQDAANYCDQSSESIRSEILQTIERREDLSREIARTLSEKVAEQVGSVQLLMQHLYVTIPSQSKP